MSDAAKLRAARLAAARACQAWEQVPSDFVKRGRRLVSASSDYVYKPARGAIFQTGSADTIAGTVPLCFTVDEAGELAFYEREPTKWSTQVAAQARRRIQRGKR